MNCLRSISLLLLSILVLSSSASADILVSFGPSVPGPLIAGSSGLINVFVRASAGTETLDGFLVEIGLSGGPAGGLIFSPIQTESQLTDPGYVFAGKSLNFNTGLPVGLVGPATTYSGADFTDDGSGPPPLPGLPAPVTLTTTNKLLFRLNLSAVTAGIYTIDVTPFPISDFLDPAFTSIPFSSIAGSITVDPAAAVPKPGSMLFCGVVAACAGVTGWCRRKKSASSCTEQTC